MERHDIPIARNSAFEQMDEESHCGRSELAPPDVFDPVLELYKRDVDRTLLIKNLSLTPAQRAEKLVDFVRFLAELRQAGPGREAE